MTVKITQVDAFTNRAFGGNPAAVCVLSSPKDDSWMQSVALEMNLSETAFLVREGDSFRLRWFTPADEVKLCGHATLASAHVLWEEGFLQRDQQAKFQTLSGTLYADWNDGWIELDFPRLPTESMPGPDGLIPALGVTPRYTGRSAYAWLVELDSEDELRKLAPDFTLLKTLDRDVIVTSGSAKPEYDFVSRYFAPRHAIDEDPVTGSAHCVLTPYWAAQLGKTELMAFQASERGGILRVRLKADRVILGGQAITTLRGELVNVG